MITTNALKLLARARLLDAQVLCRNKRCDAAVYMCGYAIEIVLKARICQTLKWPGFPETSNGFKSYIELANEENYGVEYRRGYIFQWDTQAAWMPETAPYEPKQSRTRKKIVA